MKTKRLDSQSTCSPRPHSEISRRNVPRCLIGIMFLVMMLLGVRAIQAQGQPVPAAPQQILNVQQNEAGKWFGWIIGRNRRTSVNIPQSKEEIQEFADQYGVEIKWHVKSYATSTGSDARESSPATAQPPDSTVTPSIVVRAGNQTSAKPVPQSEVVPATTPPALAPEATEGVPLSVAEQITRLERTIAADKQQLEALRLEMTSPKGEYQQSEKEFKSIEQLLATKQAEIAELKQTDKPLELKLAVESLKEIQAKHDLSRQRFDLAIETRKTVQEQMTALETKIGQNQLAREKLTGSSSATTEAPASSQPATDPLTNGAGQPVPAASPATAANPETTTTPQTTDVPPAPTSATPPGTTPTTPAPIAPAPVSEELLEARQHADVKKEEARVATLEAQSITERMQSLDKTIELEQKLFNAARKKADIAFRQRQALQTEYQDKSDAGANRTELKALALKLKDTEGQFEKARAEVSERTDRLSQLQTERAELHAEENAALDAAEKKKGQAIHAEQQVTTLQNPFSFHNMLQWLLDHGVKIALILGGILLLRSALKLSTRRLVDLMVKSGARGTPEEKEDRAKTLVGVFQNAGSLAIFVSGSLMICEEVGIAVAPLLGGAAVVGLAVAFGAQNLIRDYFYGFVILFENQYKLNDILKIGDISGQVECITLRMTVLRDLEGRVHFIPNGKIDSVTNMTHGWSRAVFDIGIAYKEDADEVMTVLMELAQGLRMDPAMAPMILEDPEMLGVDCLADSAVVLKFVIKTRPLKQWAVKRELLRRIKRRFDELGIEIPFPHRTVYHHQVTNETRTEDLGEQQDRRAA